MFLMHCKTHDLVEVLNPQALFDPAKASVNGCYHAGEELQDAQMFDKSELLFQSGETLPECWTNKHFRDKAITTKAA